MYPFSKASPSLVGCVALLTLVGCDRAPAPVDAGSRDATITEADMANAPVRAEPAGAEAEQTAPAPKDSATPPAGYTDGNGINEGYPDLAPDVLTPEVERGETGARNVLLSFARAIELREYDQAWAMLGPDAKRRWSRARFNGLFDGLDDLTVAVPGGRVEGAAGSSYYSVDAEITAKESDGRPVRIEGPLVLRCVNDVPGSTAQQRRWHIERVDLSWTH